MSESNYWKLGDRSVSRRSVLRGTAVGGLGLAGAALIGCGSGGSNAPAGGSPAASGAAPGKSAAETPVVSEAYVQLQTRDATTLDPTATTVYTVTQRVGLTYPRLLASVLQDKNVQTSNKYVPSYIVDSWEAAGPQITFKLKKGVKYQNIAPLNGREFNADDVKFSLDRYIKDPKSLFKSSYTDVTSVEAPDKYTIVLKLKAPSRYVVNVLASEQALILPPETVADYKSKVIGPGPFIHESTTQGEGSRYKKNPDFINASGIYYNNFLFKVITDAATRNAAMKTNQGDFIDSGGLAPADLKTVEGPSVKTYPFVDISGQMITWNSKNPKWKDYRTRLAMSKAFDRQLMIDQTLQGAGKFPGPIPTDFGMYALTDAEVKAHNVNKYDPAEAKKLWDAAGNPKDLPVEYYFSSNGTLDGVQSELMAKQWTQNLGVKVTLKTEAYEIYLPKKNVGGYPDMFSNGYSVPLWIDHLFFAYLPGGGRNGSLFDVPEVTKALEDLRQTLDDKEAAEKSRKIQLLIWDKYLPVAQRPTGTLSGVYNSKLRNFNVGNHPVGTEWMLDSWKVK